MSRKYQLPAAAASCRAVAAEHVEALCAGTAALGEADD